MINAMDSEEVSEATNELTGLVIEAVMKQVGREGEHQVYDALHPDVHNVIREAVDAAIKMATDAFERGDLDD